MLLSFYSRLRDGPFNFQGGGGVMFFFLKKNILILVEGKKKSDSEFLSYNLMLNSGNFFLNGRSLTRCV